MLVYFTIVFVFLSFLVIKCFVFCHREMAPKLHEKNPLKLRHTIVTCYTTYGCRSCYLLQQCYTGSTVFLGFGTFLSDTYCIVEWQLIVLGVTCLYGSQKVVLQVLQHTAVLDHPEFETFPRISVLPHLKGHPSIFSREHILSFWSVLHLYIALSYPHPKSFLASARFPKCASKALWDVSLAKATSSFSGFYDDVSVLFSQTLNNEGKQNPLHVDEVVI